MDDDGVGRYLRCPGSAVFTASYHCSLVSKSFARVSSTASGAKNSLRREHSRRYSLSGSPLSSAVLPPAQGGRSRQQQERAEVKAYLIKCLWRRAGPAGIERPDVLVQCDEGCEAISGEYMRARRGGRTGSSVYATVCVDFGAYTSRRTKQKKTYGPRYLRPDREETEYKRVTQRTDCRTPTPKLHEVLRCLIKHKRPSNEFHFLRTCRERTVVVVDRVVERVCRFLKPMIDT